MIVAALAIISVLAVLAWEIVNVVRLFRRWRQRPPATTATRFFQSWQIALRLYVAAFIGFFALVGLSLIPRPPERRGYRCRIRYRHPWRVGNHQWHCSRP